MMFRKKNHISFQAWMFIFACTGIFVLTGCNVPGSEPTPTREIATALPTATMPPATSTQTPVPSPLPTQISANFGETFDDNRNGWYTDSTLVTIEAGKYIVRLECPSAHVSPHCGTFIKIPFTFPQDFRMEIEATIVKSTSGAEVLIGFQVRRSDVHYFSSAILSQMAFIKSAIFLNTVYSQSFRRLLLI